MSMRRWSVLLKKEWLEANRSYKLLWLPVVFVLLGMMQPLTTYYLPQILQIAGGLPEGMNLTLPSYTAAEVLSSTLTSQFDQMGLIIMVIGMMGLIVSDKNNGMLTFILTRNTTLAEYLMSKWISQAVIVAAAIVSGFIVACFYTTYLYGFVSWGRIAAGLGVYYVWFLFILTLTLMLGAVFSRSSAVAVLGIVILILMRASTAFQTEFQMFNPAYLTNQAVSIITTGDALPHLLITAAAALVLILVLLFCSFSYLSRKELPSM
ncbi:ABC transporter permease [Paenibacillus nasutitermitis]|uniref:ABC transporter permease n=1 Tax=Paenibacillus nasutitermitis TaxID=1652958 RepID=A0A917E0J2_9BACL|nr:ABC transporter permease subunit [Paenibacillus nasutitermitis]GGD84725.1 ABC transporter permease [Paenibacillus nasutitermitis]